MREWKLFESRHISFIHVNYRNCFRSLAFTRSHSSHLGLLKITFVISAYIEICVYDVRHCKLKMIRQQRDICTRANDLQLSGTEPRFSAEFTTDFFSLHEPIVMSVWARFKLYLLCTQYVHVFISMAGNWALSVCVCGHHSSSSFFCWIIIQSVYRFTFAWKLCIRYLCSLCATHTSHARNKQLIIVACVFFLSHCVQCRTFSFSCLCCAYLLL